MNITPSDAQAKAIKAICEWYESGPQEFYLAGYAGVGKSTVAALAIEAIGAEKVLTGAFTGKAASVLRKKGIRNAQTIHSMIYTPMIWEDENGRERMSFRFNENGPASEADLIVLDECSMIGEEMANDLRSFDKKILIMGDPGQLPPVKGAGAFTNREPDIFLTEIHRQAAESPIIRLATMARQGEDIPVGDYGDDVVVKWFNPIEDDIYREDTQVICGVHKARFLLTSLIRESRGYNILAPLKGERVICRRNNRDCAVYNGELGVLTRTAELDDEPSLVKLNVWMDDREDAQEVISHTHFFATHEIRSMQEPPYEKSKDPLKNVNMFDWGYVLTCHNAQGSEWDHVTIVDDSKAFRADARKWLYTAITRASKGETLLKRAA